MCWIVGGKAALSAAASPSQMGRFETRWLTAQKNLSALVDLSGQWIDQVHGHRPSRGAVLAVTRSAATELGEKGIRVNAISPGGIVTGIFDKNAGLDGSKADKVTDAVRGIFARLQPIPRAGETLDIANATAFLASDGA